MIKHKYSLGFRTSAKSLDADKAVLFFLMDKQKAKEDKEGRMKEKDQLKKTWEVNNENIVVLETKYNLLKSKLEYIKRVLKEYYVKLLNQGQDIRYFYMTNIEGKDYGG